MECGTCRSPFKLVHSSFQPSPILEKLGWQLVADQIVCSRLGCTSLNEAGEAKPTSGVFLWSVLKVGRKLYESNDRESL